MKKRHLIDSEFDKTTYCGKFWRFNLPQLGALKALRSQRYDVTEDRWETTCLSCQKFYDKIQRLNKLTQVEPETKYGCYAMDFLED